MSERKTGLAHRLYTGQISYDFVARRNLWYAVSAVILVICFAALGLRGLNLGIEFKGGADFQAPVKVTATTVDDVRQAVRSIGLPSMDDISVTTISGNAVRVQTRSLSVPEISQVKQAIGTKVNVAVDQVAYNLIGASWGQQITGKALTALGVFLVLVSLMIWVYFRDYKMSIAAIVALAHDLAITLGVYALVGFTVTPATLIGVLTILGYSLYDTVVVFDKVRENVADLLRGRSTYSEAANLSVNQTLVRSINTTVIGVLPVAALLFAGAFILGTGPLKDLGLALFVGMVAGAYSSIFIATPLLAQMKEAEPGMREHRERLARRAARVGSAEAATTATVVVAAPGSPVAESTPVSTRPVGVVSAADLAQRSQPRKESRSARKK